MKTIKRGGSFKLICDIYNYIFNANENKYAFRRRPHADVEQREIRIWWPKHETLEENKELRYKNLDKGNIFEEIFGPNNRSNIEYNLKTPNLNRQIFYRRYKNKREYEYVYLGEYKLNIEETNRYNDRLIWERISDEFTFNEDEFTEKK